MFSFAALAPTGWIEFNESFQGTVVGLFNIVWKKTGRNLSLAAMIGQAFAADPLARTRFVGAVTPFFVC